MDDWQDDVTLLRYVDDMENAQFYGEKHGFGQGVLAGLTEVHDSLIDLGPLIQSGECIAKMTDIIGSTVDDLNESCIAGNEADVKSRIDKTQTAIQAVRTALAK